MEQLPITIVMKKVDGKLVITGAGNQIRYDMFVDSLGENQSIEVTHEPIHGDVSYSQLSKIHKCIRIISQETGDSFEEIKKQIKEKAGLYSKVEHLKSFGGMSKEEASKVIETIMEVATFLNINIENY